MAKRLVEFEQIAWEQWCCNMDSYDISDEPHSAKRLHWLGYLRGYLDAQGLLNAGYDQGELPDRFGVQADTIKILPFPQTVSNANPRERALATIAGVGNEYAEPGTQAWAIAVRLRINAHLQNALGDTAHFDRDLRLMERHEGYKQLCDRAGHPFTSLHAFCIAPQPYGLGYDEQTARLIRSSR